MKTHSTRRSLLWGVLLAGVAGTLIGSTHVVRAETVTSSARFAVTDDAGGSPAAKPYFWTEIAHQVQQWQLISDDFPTHQSYYVNALGVGQPTFHALSSRALD